MEEEELEILTFTGHKHQRQEEHENEASNLLNKFQQMDGGTCTTNVFTKQKALFKNKKLGRNIIDYILKGNDKGTERDRKRETESERKRQKETERDRKRLKEREGSSPIKFSRHYFQYSYYVNYYYHYY